MNWKLVLLALTALGVCVMSVSSCAGMQEAISDEEAWGKFVGE